MYTGRMMTWLSRATSYVKYPPDRRMVYSELYWHMIERNNGFLEAGMSEREADEAACRAMGDADEVGRALARVHKPWGGFILTLLRVLMALTFVFALVGFFYRGADDFLFETGLKHSYSLPECFEKRTGEAQFYAQQSSAKMGDYHFRVREAARAPAQSVGKPALIGLGEGDVLLIDCLEWKLDPFIGHFSDWYRFTITDSEGVGYSPYVILRTAWAFTSRAKILVADFNPEAKWARLDLERYGRSISLILDLSQEAKQ